MSPCAPGSSSRHQAGHHSDRPRKAVPRSESAPVKSARFKSALLRFASCSLAWPSFAFVNRAACRTASVRSAPVRSAPLRSRRFSLTSRRSQPGQSLVVPARNACRACESLRVRRHFIGHYPEDHNETEDNAAPEQEANGRKRRRDRLKPHDRPCPPDCAWSATNIMIR